MASQGESYVVKMKFKLPNRTTNLGKSKPKSEQEGTSCVEKRREVMKTSLGMMVTL